MRVQAFYFKEIWYEIPVNSFTCFNDDDNFLWQFIAHQDTP